jgi:hypothetical protein
VLCFIVADDRRERLRDVGITCAQLVTKAWGRVSACRDPERNRLQIFEDFDTSGPRA